MYSKDDKARIVVILIMALIVGLLLGLAFWHDAGATNDNKYAVCHVTADHTYPYAHYNYVEVGGLAGHFFGSNPSRPKHGAFSLAGGHLHLVLDFVTVLGDKNCDGEVDPTPTPEPTQEPTPVPTEVPQGEQCGRCSNKFDGWVEWYDRDGGCDDDYYNERVEYPGDDRCVVPTEEPTPDPTTIPTDEPTVEPTDEPTVTPTPEPVVTQCVWQQYVLRDTEGHICYIKRNFERGDSAGKLPIQYRGTGLMRTMCSETCTGEPLPWKFGELDMFWTTCGACDEGCE